MGALEEGRFNAEIENEVELCCHGGDGCDEVGFEEEPETIAIKEAVKTLLNGLNEDVNREGIKKTPFRVAKALRQGTRGYKQRGKEIVQGALFPEAGVDHGAGQAGGVGGFVVVRDLDHFSYCESCLLPFQVKFHVGYVPAGQRVVGLSKLSRVADVFAKRLQEPQRLADETCLALQHGFRPAGVAVVLQCEHLQFPSLDSSALVPTSKGRVKSVVCSGSGVFEDESSAAWAEFLSLLKFRGTMVDRDSRDLSRSWCPFRVLGGGSSKIEPAMAAAVASIIGSLGEDPSRKELAGTPARFVGWLGNFRNVEMEIKIATNGFGGVPGGGENRVESELNLPFWSQCEHHLLPFHGVVHIGYMCGGGESGPSPGRSSLLRSIVHFYGFKLQVQERLTRQIAETVSSFLGDVIVVVEASHTCMISRGIEKFGSNTATIAVLGRFSTDSAARAKFLQGIPVTTTY